MPQPSVGRVVHYRTYGTPGGEFLPECRAAIVTETDKHLDTDGRTRIGLAVLNPEGLYFNRGCPQDNDATRVGTWHWPERTEEH
ncbi:hypothetical protein [Streptomyces sp. H27-C3]|uniref:hypothetical protein n=1 Tax=Streptomyces sp. H27-C3 TaxID=3046305 RepID=UPI0024BA58AF|nr:hypothetical protein [Streptomyces sp. H27-C3]MDJ0463189.1 hypothetical protein [Streptomyces sp. H27-C3]